MRLLGITLDDVSTMQRLMLILTDEPRRRRLDDVEKKQSANAFGEYVEALKSVGVLVAS